MDKIKIMQTLTSAKENQYFVNKCGDKTIIHKPILAYKTHKQQILDEIIDYDCIELINIDELDSLSMYPLVYCPLCFPNQD